MSNVKHGHARDGLRSPAYRSYEAAKRRCQNPNDPSYADYGGRGIKFLYENFEAFFADLGERPPGTTLERCDNHGHYECGNCRWTTSREQSNNQRSNRLITAFGRTRTLARWAREIGVSHGALRARLLKGWSPEDALTRPLAQYAKSRPIIAFGRTQTQSRWSRETGIAYPTIGDRLRRGWSPEDALTRPPDRRHVSQHQRHSPAPLPALTAQGRAL
jgi:hypothetical protein